MFTSYGHGSQEHYSRDCICWDMGSVDEDESWPELTIEEFIVQAAPAVVVPDDCPF